MNSNPIPYQSYTRCITIQFLPVIFHLVQTFSKNQKIAYIKKKMKSIFGLKKFFFAETNHLMPC